jgi:putative ABC transport system substrate-binding protein
MPVIGFLRSASLADATCLIDAFRQGLREIGYVEGQNVVIEYRSAENDPDRLTALATDFDRQNELFDHFIDPQQDPRRIVTRAPWQL